MPLRHPHLIGGQAEWGCLSGKKAASQRGKEAKATRFHEEYRFRYCLPELVSGGKDKL